MSCIPVSHSMNSVLSQVEPQIKEGPVQRRGSRVYQLFFGEKEFLCITSKGDAPGAVNTDANVPKASNSGAPGAYNGNGKDLQFDASISNNIFPESNMEEELDNSSYPEDFLYRRERLPSIVVEPTEPTDQSELESELLCWPPRCQMSNSVEEEENSSVDNTEGFVNREQHDDVGTEGLVVERKSSLGPSQSQLSISRLTPPASPPPPEAVPPCLKI